MAPPTNFIWLGARRAARRGVAPAAVRLDQAARAGLPVPNGGILLDEFYQLAREAGLVAVLDGRHRPTQSGALFELLYDVERFPRLPGPLVVRPAFPLPAGQRPPVGSAGSPIPADDPAALATSLCEAWSAAGTDEPARRDVLIRQVVGGRHGGTAVTNPDQLHDLAFAGGQRLLLPRLRGWQRPRPYYQVERPDQPIAPGAEPAYPFRLQQLLRGVRRTFGAAGWTITWQDDGQICWLLQVDPLVEPG